MDPPAPCDAMPPSRAKLAGPAELVEVPPPDHEIKGTVSTLRTALDDGDPASLGKVSAGRAPSRRSADGGMLGFGAVGSEERRTIGWIESALTSNERSRAHPACERARARIACSVCASCAISSPSLPEPAVAVLFLTGNTMFDPTEIHWENGRTLAMDGCATRRR